jgi:hypothetical protein
MGFTVAEQNAMLRALAIAATPGVPLGPEWAPLRNGDLLLLSSGALLRFEEP